MPRPSDKSDPVSKAWSEILWQACSFLGLRLKCVILNHYPIYFYWTFSQENRIDYTKHSHRSGFQSILHQSLPGSPGQAEWVIPGLTRSLCPPLNVLWRVLLFKLRPHFLKTFIESGSDNIIMSGKSENKSNFTQYIKQFWCRQTKINLWSQKMIITNCQNFYFEKVSKASAEEKS